MRVRVIVVSIWMSYCGLRHRRDNVYEELNRRTIGNLMAIRTIEGRQKEQVVVV